MPPDHSDLGFIPIQPQNPHEDLGFVTTPREQGDVGLLQAAASGAGQGLFGAGDEAGAALQAIAASGGQQDSPTAAGKTFTDTFRQARTENRDIDKRAAEQHPWAYYPALVASSLVSSRLLPGLAPAAKGAPLALKALTSAVNSIPTGLAYGAGTSEADLSRPSSENVSRFVGDVEGGGASAGLMGGLGTAAMAGVARAPQALRSLALRAGSSVLGGKASAPAVEQALERGAIRLLGTTKGAASRLTADLEAKLGPQYREFLKLLEAKGIGGPEASDIAEQWLNRAVKEDSNTLGSQVPDLYMKHGEEILSKAGGDGRIGLNRAVNITRDLQSRAKYDPMVDTATNDARRAIASDMRQSVEDAVAKGAVAADPETRQAAEAFVPIKKRLGLAIEAEGAAERATKHDGPISLGELASGAAASVAGGVTYGAHGVAAGLPASVGLHLMRTRGPSTVAAGAYGLARGLEHLRGPVGSVLASYGPEESQSPAIQQALSRILGLPGLSQEKLKETNASQ